MALEIFDVNNNNRKVQTWESVEHAYIVLDYKDADRDIIKMDDKSFIKYKWKGIYAPNNILDVPDLLKKYFGNRQVKTAVIRTHGTVGYGNNITNEQGNIIGKEVIDTLMFCDNNKANNVENKKVNHIRGGYLEKYLKDPCSNNDEDSDITEYIEALLMISSYVKDGGDLVISSCRTSFIPRFFIALQALTYGRINIYGLKEKSEISYSIRKVNGVQNPVGTAYITGGQTLTNISLLKKTYSGCAFKYPMGWNNGNYPIKLEDIKLNKDGLNVTISPIQDIQPVEITPLTIEPISDFPPIVHPNR